MIFLDPVLQTRDDDVPVDRIRKIKAHHNLDTRAVEALNHVFKFPHKIIGKRILRLRHKEAGILKAPVIQPFLRLFIGIRAIDNVWRQRISVRVKFIEKV